MQRIWKEILRISGRCGTYNDDIPQAENGGLAELDRKLSALLSALDALKLGI